MYKRQEYNYGRKDRLLLFRNGLENDLEGEEFPPDKFLIGLHKADVFHPIFGAKLRCLVGWFGAACYGSVSYTHLDVYKRQSWLICSISP